MGIDAVPFPVEVAPLAAYRVVDLVIEWLNRHQEEFRFHQPPAASLAITNELREGTPGASDELWELLRRHRQNVRRHQPYIIAVMETPLRSSKGGHQLGAAYHLDDGLAAVSMHDWLPESRLKQDKQRNVGSGILAYYLVRLTIRLLGPDLREPDQEPRCVFYPRQSPQQLLRDVWDLTLCDRCIGAIAQIVSEPAARALKQLLGALKPEAFQPARRVWIACSTRGSNVVGQLHQELGNREAAGYQLEPQNVEQIYSPSMYQLESAAKSVQQQDYAVLVLTEDERAQAESSANGKPFDDVFLLGYFMGALSRHRTFMLHEANHEPPLPAHVEGIRRVMYTRRSDGSLSLVGAAVEIKNAIELDLKR
jgi:predicted nucleotide-binding protein